jgi:cytidylate kinase
LLEDDIKERQNMSAENVATASAKTLLTIAHQYGSGGSLIARELGRRLNWAVWDKELVQKIASQRLVPEGYVEAKDERVDSFMSRVAGSLGLTGFEKAYSIPPPLWLKDSELAQMMKSLIEDIAKSGRAIIVGRAGASILAQRPDALHVFIFAPHAARVKRIMEVEGLTQADAEHRAVNMDRLRADYMRAFYHADWRDPSHYHLMIDSEVWGEEGSVDFIMQALAQAPKSSA